MMGKFGKFWDWFVFQFCKVEFACWNGEPNWLGWILIGIGGYLAGFLLVGLIVWALEQD